MNQLDIRFWRDLFVGEGGLRHYGRGEYFARCGERVHYIGFVKAGYFKYVMTDRGGDEHISGFSFRGTFVGDYLGATRRESCMADIMAVTDAEVWVCPCRVLNEVFRVNNEQYLLLVDSLFRQVYDLYLDIHRLSPKERYMDLLRRTPDILQTITLKELASYLQVTPTHLSRIRRGITFGEK